MFCLFIFLCSICWTYTTLYLVGSGSTFCLHIKRLVACSFPFNCICAKIWSTFQSLRFLVVRDWGWGWGGEGGGREITVPATEILRLKAFSWGGFQSNVGDVGGDGGSAKSMAYWSCTAQRFPHLLSYDRPGKILCMQYNCVMQVFSWQVTWSS